MSLTKQPVRQKLPKPIRDRKHRRFVAGLPCLACGASPCQAHHVRLGALQLGKRVCDSKCVPLCPRCHDALHRKWGETIFWTPNRIDPIPIAAALYAISGDEEKGRLIVLGARTEGKVL